MVIVGLIALVLILASLSRFYTDVLWFQEVGLSSVLFTSLSTQFGLGAVVGLLTAAFVWLNLRLTARLAPAYRTTVAAPQNELERWRENLAPYVKWLRFGVAAFVGLSAGAGAGTAWRTYLLWRNRVPFGETDPQFGRDVGFYVFELPFLENVFDWIWFAVAAALFFSALGHLFHGAIQPVFGFRGVASGALAHLSVLLGLLALTKAAQYWLGQYQLNFSPRGVVTGASYTDVHAQLPALRLLAIISVISAVLFIVNIRFRSILLPLAAVGIWLLTSVLAGAAWPAAVQYFSVRPQELPREREFIERNLEATRTAFDLEDVTTTPFQASLDLTAEEIAANENVLQNVRLWDPDVIKRAYAQLQAIRTYYDFADVDIDRYEVAGEQRQVLLSARELFLTHLEQQSQTWSNLHLQYTHGFGVIASLGNSLTSAGQPNFLVKDVPGTVVGDAPELELDQPRIYYGEAFEEQEYSVVDTDQAELDYPSLEGEGAVRSRYDGEGGVPIGSLVNRIAFAIREGDPNLVLSGLIRGDSKILFYRNVRDRVLRAAPFLALDHDPYIAAVDGRLVWIIDAYTTSNFYPYSQRFNASGLVPAVSGTLSGELNYIRNSVKVVVDAHDGTMEFYVIDEEDPLIQVWRNAFPSLFTDEEPSESLQAHFRYPEDLFLTQSQVFLTYHMTDPDEFYAKEDAWQIPRNPVGNIEDASPPPGTVTESEQPATYLVTQLPGETNEEFVLIRPFTPRNRDNMIAVFVGRSDPGVYGELLTLELPTQRVVQGPVQVNNLINQETDVSQAITLLSRAGSRVQFGSLVTLPIEDSILYVQPLYVIAADGGIPELKRVVLVLGEEVVMEETFEEAVAALFGVTEEPTEPEPEPEPTDGPGPEEPDDLASLIAQAAELYERAQQALSDGDLATYARLIERVGRLLDQANQLANQ